MDKRTLVPENKVSKVKYRGQIVSGSDQYRYIGIQENFNIQGDFGGLNILMSVSPSFDPGFDDWVDDYESLLVYLQGTGWVVKWLPNESESNLY
jgi:hypothetical protein